MIHSLKFEQKIPISIDEAWDFLSSPKNLKTITPSHMGFEIISKYHGEKMYAGQIIEYIVKPILSIPIKWCTEITHVSEPNYFVDEQRFGPYIFWHHQHHIKAIEGGVEMTDIIHYKLPFGILGDIMNYLMVKKQLQQIFDFRFKKVIELYGDFK
jgi:ligand-binding SRPBCC domain-containing protein